MARSLRFVLIGIAILALIDRERLLAIAGEHLDKFFHSD